MFDLLAPGKKISLFACIAIAFMMLTGFVACLTEDGGNIEWACWLGYYSLIGYGVVLFFSELDLRNNMKDIARVATCVFAMAAVVGIVAGTQIFPLIMLILAFLACAAVLVLGYTAEQKFDLVYCIMTFGFLLFMIFWIILVAGSTSQTVFLMAFDFPTAIFAIAAGIKAYQILKEA